MHTCQLCQVEYEREKHAGIVCNTCAMRVLTTSPARLLSAESRLWGKCYAVGGCWEFGQRNGTGRAQRIMLDGRQKPAAQVALYLAGFKQPSADHFARVTCGNPMCVRPIHLEWVAPEVVKLDPVHLERLSKDELVRYLEVKRAKKAKYQRNFRRKQRAGEVGKLAQIVPGAPAVVVAVAPSDVERVRALRAAEREADEARGGLSQMAWDTLQRQQKWDAMTAEEHTALLAQLPGPDELPANDRVGWRQAVGKAARALGIPADEAIKARPVPVAAPVPALRQYAYPEYDHVILPPGLAEEPETLLEATPGGAAVAPELIAEGASGLQTGPTLGALLGGVRIAPVD